MTIWVLSSVMLVGLLSGVHCAGMCGGIVGALTLNLPRDARRQWPLHLAYNAGRIASYTFAGFAAGALGSVGLLMNGALPVQLWLYVAANLMLVALGLHLAGMTRFLSAFEAQGAKLWRLIAPLAKRATPARTPSRAFVLGLLWGWLPCGLVYSVLATAIFSGDAWSGAAVMLAFGLGTLPNLLFAGLLLRRLRGLTALPLLRRVAGALVLGLGAAGLANAAEHAEAMRAGLICHFF